MNKELYFYCKECNYLMCADPSEYDVCYCGAMSKDIDYGRFGSKYGDNEIAVYKRSELNSGKERYAQRAIESEHSLKNAVVEICNILIDKIFTTKEILDVIRNS